MVRRELRKFRANGPAKTTRALTDVLARAGVEGMTLLDIGGGVGAVQVAMFRAGIAEAECVEASRAFVEAAAEVAGENGYDGRVTHRVGDFVELTHQVAVADVVTLDRVICCYPHLDRLVTASAARARRLYGVVYPRDRWTVRAYVRFRNFVRRVRRNPFRTFVFSNRAIDRVIRAQGLEELSRLQTYAWRVAVYARTARTPPS